MMKTKPILLLDDDPDDLLICVEILREIGVNSEIHTFQSCSEAYDYLADPAQEDPFIVISDINLPTVNGLELKKTIDADPALKRKSIPFVFYSTSGDAAIVEQAFECSVQGFFIKENSIEKIKRSLQLIIEYWLKSLHPKSN